MFKQRVDWFLAEYLLIYVYYGNPINPTKTLCWKSSKIQSLTCSWLGIQEASRKVQPPSQAPGPWAGADTNTKVCVHLLVSQDIRDKTWRLIAELLGTERKGSYGMSRARMESIR